MNCAGKLYAHFQIILCFSASQIYTEYNLTGLILLYVLDLILLCLVNHVAGEQTLVWNQRNVLNKNAFTADLTHRAPLCWARVVLNSLIQVTECWATSTLMLLFLKWKVNYLHLHLAFHIASQIIFTLSCMERMHCEYSRTLRMCTLS